MMAAHTIRVYIPLLTIIAPPIYCGGAGDLDLIASVLVDHVYMYQVCCFLCWQIFAQVISRLDGRNVCRRLIDSRNRERPAGSLQGSIGRDEETQHTTFSI